MLATSSTAPSGSPPIKPWNVVCRSRQRTGPLMPCGANTARRFKRSTTRHLDKTLDLPDMIDVAFAEALEQACMYDLSLGPRIAIGPPYWIAASLTFVMHDDAGVGGFGLATCRSKSSAGILATRTD